MKFSSTGEEFPGAVSSAVIVEVPLQILVGSVFSENNHFPTDLSDVQESVPECIPSPPFPADHVLYSGAVLFPGSYLFTVLSVGCSKLDFYRLIKCWGCKKKSHFKEKHIIRGVRSPL